MNAAAGRSPESAQRELQIHLIAAHARAMATGALALLEESRACAHCAALIAARDLSARNAEYAGDLIAG